jgi:serine protease
VFGLTALLFGVKKLRPTIGGFALGTAALLVQLGISGETFYGLGSIAMRLWAVVNVVMCVWIARMTIDTKND